MMTDPPPTAELSPGVVHLVIGLQAFVLASVWAVAVQRVPKIRTVLEEAGSL